MKGSASLNVSGELIEPTVPVKYKVKVPEPSSILGILAFGAFGAGTLLKRQLKNRKLAIPGKSNV